MTMNVSKLLMSSATISGKLILQGEGTATIPASLADSESSVEIPIPHGHTDDELIWQVGIAPNGSSDLYFTPFSSQSQTVKYVSYVDSTNLYVEAIQGGATDRTALNFAYSYRVFIP